MSDNESRLQWLERNMTYLLGRQIGTPFDNLYIRQDGTKPFTANFPAGAFRFRFGSGTDYLQIAPDGEVTLVGTARVMKDANIEVGIPAKGSGNPPDAGTKDNFDFDRYHRSTEQEVFVHWEIPHDYASAGTVCIHFEFIVENPPVNPNGDEAVVMGVEYKKLSTGDVFDFSAGTSSATITETIAEDETDEIVHTTGHMPLTTTGFEPMDILLLRFYRDATNPNDTYDNEGAPDNNDVWVSNYHIEYLSDKLGEAT